MVQHPTFVVCLLLCLPKSTWQAYHHEFFSRMHNLMKEHLEDSTRKIQNINHIRFEAEGDAVYEMAYVMGEIIERYRKMVEHLKRPVMYKSESIFDTILRVRLIENLYFEIYHLVHMMHEIPRKYGWIDGMTKAPEANAAAAEDQKKVQEAYNKLERDKAKREKEKKKKLKDLKKLREKILHGQTNRSSTLRPQNKWWPIEYGWEVDYYW